VLIDDQEVYYVDDDQLAWTVHTVDLMPWQGQTIGIVFEHFSYPTLEGGPGWYIDDVALNEGFMIKFQAFDNNKIDLCGLSFDDICVQRLNQAELTVDPTHLSSIQTPDRQRQNSLTLINSGGGELIWQLFEEGTAVHVQGPVVEETVAAQSDALLQDAEPEMVEHERDETSSLIIRPRNDLLYDQSDNVTTLRGANSQEYEPALSDFDSCNQEACTNACPIGAGREDGGQRPFVMYNFYKRRFGLCVEELNDIRMTSRRSHG